MTQSQLIYKFVINFDSVEYGCFKLVLKSGCYAQAQYITATKLNCIYYSLGVCKPLLY